MPNFKLLPPTLAIATSLFALPAWAKGPFDGAWLVTRSTTQLGCTVKGSVFTIRIRDGVVSAPGGRGLVSTSGQIRFPGEANRFAGRLSGNAGSGTYAGKCSGVFSAGRK